MLKSYYELVALEQKDALETLYMNLMGRRFALETGEKPTEEGYQAQISDYVASWGGDEASAREVNTRDSYEFFFYNNVAVDCLTEVIRKAYFKEET